MIGRVASGLRRAGRARRGTKGRKGAARRRRGGGARTMARKLTGRG